MKLTQKQLRGIVRQVVNEAPRRKGGARAGLGFGIPEDSPEYGADSKGVGSFTAALEDVGCDVLASNPDGTISFRFPGLSAVATVQLKLFEI